MRVLIDLDCDQKCPTLVHESGRVHKYGHHEFPRLLDILPHPSELLCWHAAIYMTAFHHLLC